MLAGYAGLHRPRIRTNNFWWAKYASDTTGRSPVGGKRQDPAFLTNGWHSWIHTGPVRRISPPHARNSRALPCWPDVENFLGRDDIDLLAEARPKMSQHGIVGFVGGAAQCVRGEDHATTGIDRIHHGREDAHIGLAARDHQGISLKLPEHPQESSGKPVR